MIRICICAQIFTGVCIQVRVCVYMCERMQRNSIFIHLGVVVKSYNTTNVTLVIQHSTKDVNTKNDGLLKKWQEFKNSF